MNYRRKRVYKEIVNMPVDLEMILSASPPLFTTAAFMDFRYSPFNRKHHLTTVNGFSCGNGDIRPCLAVKDTQNGNGDEHKCCKKRVWFADDKGLSLTHVKIMSEPSNCPPQWSDEFLDHITKGIKNAALADCVHWEPVFAQPASNYMEFRSKLQKSCISLENVIIREGEDNITGTIKVKNIAFDKEVFVRITFNRWHSSQDIPATYVPNGVEGGTTLYDTFSFSLSIPPSAVKFETVEFCVCFKCSGETYWDNNNGVNYKLIVSGKKSSKVDNPQQFNDALHVNLDSWSEFASWSHLITEGPYW